MSKEREIKLTWSLVRAVDADYFLGRLSDIPTPELISLFKGEKDWRVRQAMASELSKRLGDVIRSGNFVVV